MEKQIPYIVYEAESAKSERTIKRLRVWQYRQEKNIGDVLSVIDELMEAVYVYNRQLYDATIRKLNT